MSEVVTIKEAAELLSVSTKTIKRNIEKGLYKVIEVSPTQKRIDKDSLYGNKQADTSEYDKYHNEAEAIRAKIELDEARGIREYPDRLRERGIELEAREAALNSQITAYQEQCADLERRESALELKEGKLVLDKLEYDKKIDADKAFMAELEKEIDDGHNELKKARRYIVDNIQVFNAAVARYKELTRDIDEYQDELENLVYELQHNARVIEDYNAQDWLTKLTNGFKTGLDWGQVERRLNRVVYIAGEISKDVKAGLIKGGVTPDETPQKETTEDEALAEIAKALGVR